MDDREFLEKRLELFAHEGWSLHLKELEEWAESLEKILTITDEKELYQKQGQLMVLNILLNLEETTKLALDTLIQED